MRFHVKIVLVFIPVILLASFLMLYSQEEGPIIERGDRPEFSFTIVDNGDNDFVEMKYIKAGTLLYNTPDPLPLEGSMISIWPKENYLQLYEFELPPENLFLNENIKIFTNANVINAERIYFVYITYMYDSAPYEVVAEAY